MISLERYLAIEEHAEKHGLRSNDSIGVENFKHIDSAAIQEECLTAR